MLLYTADHKLPCPLSNDELLTKGDALAALLRDIEAEEEAQTKAKASMKEQLAAMKESLGDLRRQVPERREFRDVPVDIFVADSAKALLREVRRDTGEIVRERFATDDERQQLLKF